MVTVQMHGYPPYCTAVLHGGPGAAGDVAPVARKLGEERGVLEPHQRATSLWGQVQELQEQLARRAAPPVTLIGHSWGAWLAWIFAAQKPRVVRRLVLVSSGAFRPEYAADLMNARRARLSAGERSELDVIVRQMSGDRMPKGEDGDEIFARFGALMSRADSYDPFLDDAPVQCDMKIYRQVWPEAAALRSTGELLNFGRQIYQPVTALHGDWDPSLAEGVREPLSSILADFTFIVLKDCGHSPWRERRAADEFYRVLREIIDK